MAQNGQKWPKNTQNYLFGHFDYVMILSLFFLCFFAVNENLAGKKLNVQEKKLPPDREICQFWNVFSAPENFSWNNDPIGLKFSGVVKWVIF